MSWLWFLVALFIVVLVCYPMVIWTERRKRKIPVGVLDWALICGQAFALCIMFAAVWPMINYNNIAFDYLAPAMAIQFGAFMLQY